MPRLTRIAVAASTDARPSRRAVLSDRQAAGVTPAELQEVLLQQSYSAEQRTQRLKEMLTDLTENENEARTPEQRRMIETIREILKETQGAPSVDEDRS